MRRKNKNVVRQIIGLVVMIASWALGAYLGIWTFFIQPIISACQAFDTGTLTGTIVGITVLKCLFAGTIGSLIAYFGTLLAKVIAR